MAAEIHRLRDRAGETEKITINLGYVDLGHIDLLVQEGFYSNRTDFIRTAIRNRLASHAEEVKKSIVRHTLELGLRHFTRADLEAARAAENSTSSVRVSRARASIVSPRRGVCAFTSYANVRFTPASRRPLARWKAASPKPTNPNVSSIMIRPFLQGTARDRQRAAGRWFGVIYR